MLYFKALREGLSMLPSAEPRRVDREDDGAAARGGGSREMLARDATVLEDVELAPLHEPRRGGGESWWLTTTRTRRSAWPSCWS